MKIQAVQSTLRQIHTDAVALFIPEDKKLFDSEITQLKKTFGQMIENVTRLENFHGKENETVSFLTHKKIPASRVYLAGIGKSEKISSEQFRRSAASVAKHAQSMKLKEVSFRVATAGLDDTAISFQDAGKAIAEGSLLSLYAFNKYITEKKSERTEIKSITLFDSSAEKVKTLKIIINRARIVCEGTILARDLANAPACEIYPETLAETARASAEKYGYSATIWDKKRIEKEGFGGLLAVNAGSARPPRFIILEHNQDKKELDTIVLIGKGITFDSGGISIKPSAGMAEMKMDMSGAAAVIGTIEAAARLKLPLHIVGLIPATENLPSGSAMKPGDIIKHYGGKTSEVDNTDAEGRLVLADAIAYASSYNPVLIIDLATLTGACVVALGNHATGMMGNDDEIMKKLTSAGNVTHERVWQLPLFEEYEKQIKSDIADVKNVGGRWAGAITAGLFLKKFLPKVKIINGSISISQGRRCLKKPSPTRRKAAREWG